MRWPTLFALLAACSMELAAHQPDRENQRIWPRIDLIPPLGVSLPSSYARRYNRPSSRVGRLLYQIAPASREAMAWHDASHQEAYRLDRGRLEKHFFYAKPWERLRLGPREETVPHESTVKPIVGSDLRKAVRMDDLKLSNPTR